MDDTVRLNNLLTYTVFHIGVYISLVAALIGAGVLGHVDHPTLRFAAGCFLLAGVCGAAVGSNIPEYDSWTGFSQDKIGFWGQPMLNYSVWVTIEHAAFWVGLLPIAATFIFCGPTVFKDY